MRNEGKRISEGRVRVVPTRVGRTSRAGRSSIATLWCVVMVLSIAATATAEEPRADAPGVEPSAASAFDARFSPATRAGGTEGVGLAGRVVERFAPPVAAPIEAVGNPVPVALSRGPLLRPCDTPGSGCQNVQPTSTQVGVPPIVPGTRPPQAPNP